MLSAAEAVGISRTNVLSTYSRSAPARSAARIALIGPSRSIGSAARIRTIRMLFSARRAGSGATRAIRPCGLASDRDATRAELRTSPVRRAASSRAVAHQREVASGGSDRTAGKGDQPSPVPTLPGPPGGRLFSRRGGRNTRSCVRLIGPRGRSPVDCERDHRRGRARARRIPLGRRDRTMNLTA